jgi:hypothetical protein
VKLQLCLTEEDNGSGHYEPYVLVWEKDPTRNQNIGTYPRLIREWEQDAIPTVIQQIMAVIDLCPYDHERMEKGCAAGNRFNDHEKLGRYWLRTDFVKNLLERNEI